MQKKKSGSNNPINPLGKAVSLLVAKDEAAAKPSKAGVTTPLTISLQFNTAWLYGETVDKNNQPVTVSFNLSVSYAVLELRAQFVDPKPAQSLKLIKPMHEQSAVRQGKTKTIEKQTSSTVLKGTISGEVKGRVGASGASAQAAAGIKGSASAAHGNDDKSTRTAAHTDINIGLTQPAPNCITWTIGATDGSGPPLTGQMFKAKNNGAHAAKAVRDATNSSEAFEVHGSVRVNFNDHLQISDVKFQRSNSLGFALKNLKEDVLNETATSSDKLKMGLGGEPAILKERIARLIICRELSAQGLDVGSANIEVCRAWG